MSENEKLFGNYPFPPDKKKPIHIRGELIKDFLYPSERPHFSVINKLYVSTDKLTVATWQFGPGGTYDPPDIHVGDEVYYVLEGELTEHNPEIGEFIQVKKGEALLLPKGGYHKGYNLGQDIMRIFYVVAPKFWEGDMPTMDFEPSKMKMYKGKFNDKIPSLEPIPQWNIHGTTDDIGRWPVPGPQCRKKPILFYHITEDKKLINVHGTKYPMLVKFFVSNDLVHMGEFILPAGGTGCRASEPDSHKGECVLFVEKGPVTVFLTDSMEAFDIPEEETMFLPEGVEYQLINYTDDSVKVIFSIAPNL